MPRPYHRKVVDEIQEVRASSEYDSSILRVRRGLEEILGDVHVHLAAEPRLNPARLAILMTGRPRYKPLRWSQMTAEEKTKIEDFIPYIGTEDYVKYGDTVVVVCPKAEYEAELRRKAQEAAKASGVDQVAAEFAQQAGLPVNTKWENLGAEHAPRPIT